VSPTVRGRSRSSAATISAVFGVLTFAVVLGLDFPASETGPGDRAPMPFQPVARSWISWSSSAAAADATAVEASAECPQPDFVDAASALPSPCQPGVAAPGETLLASLSRQALPLRQALDALQRGRLARARSLAQQTDAVNQHIVSWMALTSGAGRLSSADVETTMQTLHDWP